MKRWTLLYLSVALLARAAPAAEMTLEVSPPEPKWVMPPLICRNSSIGLPVCRDADTPSGDASLFHPPRQQQPEGIPDPGEEQILIDIGPLIARGDYQAALDRIEVYYPELALLEIGDDVGFRRQRMAIGGGGQGAAPPGPAGAPGEGATGGGEIATPTRNIRPPSALGVSPASIRATAAPATISASLLFLIGHSYFALNRYVPAEAAFNIGLSARPSHPRLHESLGMLYLRTGRYAEARTQLLRAIELGRNTANVHAAVGYLEQKARHYWAAANAFQRALVLAPDDRSALRGLLHALTETHEHAKATALVERLLRDEPDDPGLWLYRAQIALAAGELASAVASLETALRLGDGSLENLRACAALHIETGNIARAVELLRGSAARGLDFALVDQALGWLANENEWEDFRALAASVDRATLGGADQSRLLTRRASLALHDGNRRAVSAGLQEALTLDPANGDALLALAQLYRAERDYGRADLLLQRAELNGPVRESALVARAEVAIDRQDFAGAIDHLRSVAIGNPARADVRRNIDVLENLVLLRTER